MSRKNLEGYYNVFIRGNNQIVKAVSMYSAAEKVVGGYKISNPRCCDSYCSVFEFEKDGHIGDVVVVVSRVEYEHPDPF